MSIKLKTSKLLSTLNTLKTITDTDARVVIQALAGEGTKKTDDIDNANNATNVDNANNTTNADPTTNTESTANRLILTSATPDIAIMTQIDEVLELASDANSHIANMSLSELVKAVSVADKAGTTELTVMPNGDALTVQGSFVATSEDGADFIHEFPATDESRNTRGILASLNYGIFQQLTYENACDSSSPVLSLPRSSVLSSLSKCILADNDQIIISKDAQAFTACTSSFVVYANDSNISFTCTINTKHAKILCAVLKNYEFDNLLIYIDKAGMFISDDKNNFYMQFSLPSITRGSVLNQINQFHSVDYSENEILLNKKKLLNSIKIDNTLNKESLLTFTFNDSKACLNNTISFSIAHVGNLMDTYKPFSIVAHADVINNILSKLDTPTIHMSTTRVVESTDDENNATHTLLVRFAEYNEDGTLRTCCYTVSNT